MRVRIGALLIAAGTAICLAACGGAPETALSTVAASQTAIPLAPAPSDADLSIVQGFGFQDALAPQSSTASEAWVADARDARTREAGVGALSDVAPADCEAMALMAGYGMIDARSDSLATVGFSMRRSNSGQAYPTQGSVDTWRSTAYDLPPGQAEHLARVAARTWEECSAFTLVQAGGGRRPGERAHNLTAQRGWRVSLTTSGDAVIRRALLDGPVGAQLVTIMEPIGDILYVTYIGIWSKEAAVWHRATDLYNRLADQVAPGPPRAAVDLTAG